MNKVIIIGGGASGMMAALTAAEDKNNDVTIIERQQRVGRKLLATGNGRCNLTNTGASAENYHGENPDFALPALNAFTPQDTLDFFHTLGLVTVEEYGGRVYPLSNSANSVVDVLRFAMESRGVKLVSGTSAKEISRSGAGYTVKTDSGTFEADDLIVACGGAAGAKLGGVMDGYELLKPLGHKRTKLCPALVQLITEGDYPKALKGIRCDVGISLIAGSETIKASRGELQFIETGLSGPAVFDISREASVGGSGMSVKIDFMRDFDADEVFNIISAKRSAYPALDNAELFTGIVHNRLGKMLVKYANLRPSTLGALTDGQLYAAVRAAKEFTLKVLGTEGFDSAQVTAGGIKTTGINPETMESRFMPHLFICGELLDIDADCGGFNLQWAWASGRLAGRLGR